MAGEKKSGGLLDEAAEVFSGFTGIVNGDVFDPGYWKGAEAAPAVKEKKSNDDDGEVIEEERTVRRSKRGTFLAAPKGTAKPDDAKPDDAKPDDAK